MPILPLPGPASDRSAHLPEPQLPPLGKGCVSALPAGTVTRWCPALPSLLQLAGDLGDLEPALNKTKSKHVMGSGSCSALIKLLPGQSDLLIAHNTWSSYQNMLRIIKKYWFQFREDPQGGWIRVYLRAWACVGARGGLEGGRKVRASAPRMPRGRPQSSSHF